MKTLEGKTAAITGAAGGIGLALASALVQRGARVALADVNEELLEQSAHALRTEGAEVSTHLVDVSSYEAVERFRDDAIAEHGAVDILMNNAGLTMFGALDQFSMQQIERIVGVNLMGVIHGCHAFLPHLKGRPDAHIVNMSSMAAISGMPMQSTYCATKAAVRGLSQSLSAELAPTSVNVTWMVAGPIGTSIMANAESFDTKLTDKMNQLLQSRAMKPETAAQKILRAVLRNQPEIRLTLSCEAYHQLNRLSPGLVRASMRTAHGFLGGKKSDA